MTANIVIVSTLTSIVVSLILFALRGWITGGIKSYFDKRLEVYKAELRARSDIELERERARLRVLTEAALAPFPHLAELRIKRLVTLYELLVIMAPTLERYVNPMKIYTTTDPGEIENANKQLREETMKAYAEFHAFALPSRVFLDRKTCDELDKVLDIASEIVREYHWASAKEAINVDRWTKAHDKARNKLVELRESLRLLIGSLIGVEEKDKES